MRLDYLYALTVADMYATNPTLWNSWRATLMHQLYTETRRTLRRGLESASDKAVTVAAYQDQALERLAGTAPHLDEAKIRGLWADFGDDFFLRHTVPQISTLTETIAAHTGEAPFIAVYNTQGDLPGEGATRVYVYTPDQPQLFAKTVAMLARQRLSVVDAQVNTGPSGMCLDTYTVLTTDGHALPDDAPERAELEQHLKAVLADDGKAVPKVSRRLSRQQRELTLPTEVSLMPAGDGRTSILTIVAADRPGLLAGIGEMFIQLDLQLCSAKIATLGERVEDTFVIQNEAGEAIADGEATYMLEQTIRQRLDRQVARHGG